MSNLESKNQMSEELSISNDHKKSCLVYGNCQCYLITSHLNLSKEFGDKYNFEKPLMNFEAIKNKTVISSEILEKTQLFLYQPIDNKYGEQSTDYILERLPSNCTRIAFPYVYFDGYWPQDTKNPMNKPDAQYPFGKFPYGDFNIINMLEKAYPKQQILQEIQKTDFYSQEVVIQKLKKTLEELTNREALTGIKVSDFIRTNYNRYNLFHTPRHPANLIGLNVANQILEKLGMKEISKPHNLEILGRYQVPIYPSVIKALNLEFVSYESQYTLYFSDKKLTFNEYIEEYFNQYK